MRMPRSPLGRAGSAAVRPAEGQSCEPKGTAGRAGVSSWRRQNLVRKTGGYSRQKEVCAAKVIQKSPIWGSCQWR